MQWPSDFSWHANVVDAAWTCPTPSQAVRAFHARLDGYAVTPCVELPPLAKELGVGRVFAKFEDDRFGLPAFKGLGASWAIHCALAERDGVTAKIPIIAATDGNHGRAVAHFARLMGHPAIIVLPRGVSAAATSAIQAEGADVRILNGDYDAAVAEAARVAAATSGVHIQDTAWPGYEAIPTWIVEGYETLLAELDEQLQEQGVAAPSLVVVPAGVGSITQAVVQHYRAEGRRQRAAILNVEPTSAPCVLASLALGERTSVETGDTIMAGLNCNSVSTIAWPILRAGLDAAVSVDDDADRQAMRDLSALGLDAGSCGASVLAGARAALAGQPERRSHLGITGESVVVLLVTERRLPDFVI